MTLRELIKQLPKDMSDLILAEFTNAVGQAMKDGLEKGYERGRASSRLEYEAGYQAGKRDAEKAAAAAVENDISTRLNALVFSDYNTLQPHDGYSDSVLGLNDTPTYEDETDGN